MFGDFDELTLDVTLSETEPDGVEEDAAVIVADPVAVVLLVAVSVFAAADAVDDEVADPDPVALDEDEGDILLEAVCVNELEPDAEVTVAEGDTVADTDADAVTEYADENDALLDSLTNARAGMRRAHSRNVRVAAIPAVEIELRSVITYNNSMVDDTTSQINRARDGRPQRSYFRTEVQCAARTVSRSSDTAAPRLRECYGRKTNKRGVQSELRFKVTEMMMTQLFEPFPKLLRLGESRLTPSAARHPVSHAALFLVDERPIARLD